MTRIEVDFNLNDSEPSIVAFLGRIKPLMDALDGERGPLPEIDLRRCKYIGPDAVSLIAALHADAARKSLTLIARLPEAPSELVGFCQFSGLTALWSGPAPNHNHPDNETLSVRRIHGSPATWARQLRNLVARHTELSSDDVDYIEISVNEVAQNVMDHANSPIDAMFCAKYMSRSREVRVAIVDRGVGVYQSLKRGVPNVLDSKHALSLAIQGDHSARSRDTNYGQGLLNLSMMVRRLDGKLWMISGNATLILSHKQSPYPRQYSGIDFRGTGVFFTLRLPGSGKPTIES